MTFEFNHRWTQMDTDQAAGQVRLSRLCLHLCLSVFICGCLCLDVARAAAPTTNAAEGRERDLGLGLAYYRIHKLPDDLPASGESRPPACVMDVRYVRTNAAGADVLR